jgi:heat shock 70kDa protein 4
MSVAGIDVGDQASCIAVARKRGVDVLLNKESKRETPTLVSFGPATRALGTDAVGALTVNPRNTVSGIKRLLGKRFDDPALQADAARLPYKVVPSPDGSGGVAVAVNYLGEERTFSPEQLLAMVIVDQKAVAAADGSPVTDAVLTVPTYFTERERHAVLAAAEIAGVSCLRLLNETTAAALAYGIYKTDLPEGASPPLNVAFVDAGADALQVSIVSFTKGRLAVRAHAWDRDLGGRVFDEALFDHFADEFKGKYGVDARESPKSSFRLRLGCEKLKKLLSSIPEAPMSVEGLTPEVDAQGFMTREAFLSLPSVKDALGRMRAPMEAALAQAGLAPGDVAAVEVIGGASRMPALAETVQAVFGKAPSRTLNAKEAVSRGAALNCAMLSPIFRVRDFEVVEACPYGVEVAWAKPDTGERTSTLLFERGGPVPSAKVLTFVRDAPFELTAAYAPDAHLPAGSDRSIAAWTIGPPLVTPARPEGTKAKLKVKVKLHLHGVIGVEYVQQVEEEEVEEAGEGGEDASAAAGATPADAAGDEPMADAAGGADAGAAGAAAAASADAPMEEGDASAAAAAASAAPAAPAPKKKRVKKHTVGFDVTASPALPAPSLADMCEAELQMALQAKAQEEKADAKNAVEAYIYSLRNRLADSLGAFATESEKEAIGSALEKAEDWLYDEGEDVARSVYVAKLEELKTLGGPVETRAAEAVAAPPAAAALEAAAAGFKATAAGPGAAHIPEADRAKVEAEADAALAWLAEKRALAAAAPPTADPAFTAADAAKKEATLRRVCEPILATPKPAPPPPPAPKADEAAAGAEGGECAAGEGEGGEGAEPAANGECPAEGMETEEAKAAATGEPMVAELE